MATDEEISKRGTSEGEPVSGVRYTDNRGESTDTAEGWMDGCVWRLKV
jgi:hypothetical protein